MSGTPVWIPLLSVVLGSLIALGSQLLIYRLSERGRKVEEHRKYQIQRLRDLALLLGEIRHNTIFNHVFAFWSDGGSKEKVNELFVESLLKMGYYTDISYRHAKVKEAIDAFGTAVAGMKDLEAKEQLSGEEKLRLDNTYNDVLIAIDDAIRKVDESAPALTRIRRFSGAKSR